MPDDSTFRRTPRFHLQALEKGLLAGDRNALSHAITLIESKRAEDKELAGKLIESILLHTGKSFKIGITGVPGVGKSTFIESIGKLITGNGQSVAVLSVDPSSSKTRGSILGDKTRMNQLANDPKAFIRPTAAGDTLGGVASNTRETIMLCEAAGYETVLIETVGVGQSETMVKDMVDYFLVLMLAGGGDELQGIKRGIMELADHILINKSDGDNISMAKRAQEDVKNALHLFPPNESGWVVPVELCSSIEETGISEALETIEEFKKHVTRNGWLDQARKVQRVKWFHDRIASNLKANFYSNPTSNQAIMDWEEKIQSQSISVRKAVEELFKNYS